MSNLTWYKYTNSTNEQQQQQLDAKQLEHERVDEEEE